MPFFRARQIVFSLGCKVCLQDRPKCAELYRNYPERIPVKWRPCLHKIGNTMRQRVFQPAVYLPYPDVGATPRRLARYIGAAEQLKENTMPVLLLWGIPALILVGGGGYWLMHLH
jgi:hypothetical protein